MFLRVHFARSQVGSETIFTERIMSHSPLLLLHICAGTVGCLSGFVAVSLRKGSRQHALAGTVFVTAMLTLAASGVFLATLKSQPGNILGGTLTFYLVATAWITAKRKDEGTRIFDWGALFLVATLFVFQLTFALQAATSPTGHKYGYPPGPYIFLGSVSLLSTIGDIRMLVRGGISGTRRIARHLWRMCFAFFIASASIFLARQQLFPVVMRKTGALYVLSLLPLALMIFWLIRVRFANAYRRMRPVVVDAAPSLQVR